MDTEVIKLLATQGAFAILFCYLLFYTLKENSNREDKYQEIIKELSESIPIIREEIKEINDKLN